MTESLRMEIVVVVSCVLKLELIARMVYDPVPAEIGVPVRYALSVPLNANDKSDRRSGEKMFVMGTLLVK